MRAILFLVFCLTLPSQARSFRPARIPNGTVASCSNCHVNPSGGGTRTPFGESVLTALRQLPNSPSTSADNPFWTAALAAADSDGDGVSNGAELRDPDGDGTAIDAVGATNPGNRPPVFTSTPVTVATMGLAYSYQAVTTDAESNTRTYTKTAGPGWILVSGTGLVTGTPPATSGGVQSITIRATDAGTSSKGFSRDSTNQTYTLAIGSSFAGWQNLNFTLPAQANLALSSADPDQDGLSNLMEYALRSAPQSPGTLSYAASILTPGGQLRLMLPVRDDDAKLTITMEAASESSFVTITTITNPIITDPVPGDGLRTLEFLDTAMEARRFGRLKFRILP